MNMIDKVAEAICIRRNADDWPCNGLDFDMELARVAIEAMREPTKKMLKVTVPDYGMVLDNYQAMIDAALEE